MVVMTLKGHTQLACTCVNAIYNIGSNSWVVDNCASYHFAINGNLLTNVCKLKEAYLVSLSKGQQVSVSMWEIVLSLIFLLLKMSSLFLVSRSIFS